MNIKKIIAKTIARETSQKQEEIVKLLVRPPKKEFGDYSVHCNSFSKESPVKTAKRIAEKLSHKKPRIIETISSVGPYLNFFLNKELFAEKTLKQIILEKNVKPKKNTKKVLIEYSSPNTNKPLHIGHLRNDSIGMALANILEFTGNKVIKTSLFNDRGIHICKTMLAYKLFAFNKNPLKEKIKPDKFVGNLYVLFNKESKKNPELEKQAFELLKKWEQGDRETIALWKKLRKWAITGIKQTYKKFGSKFDFYSFESEHYNKAKPIIRKGLKKKVFVKQDNAVIALLEPELPNKTVLRSDGTSIYLTQDLVLTTQRMQKFKPHKAIWVVGEEQKLYFKQLFRILEKLGYKWVKKCVHVWYGLVLLPEGKLKSREGKVIDADTLIEELEKNALKKVKQKNPFLSKKEAEKISTLIALAAIKFWMLKTELNKPVHFNPKKSISFQGETGPYILYTIVRTKKLLKKAGKFKKEYSSLKEEHELIRELYIFPEIVKKASETLNPSILCNYLLKICMLYNSFYQKKPVLKSTLKNQRLTLTKATQKILLEGLTLLNIKSPEKM